MDSWMDGWMSRLRSTAITTYFVGVNCGVVDGNMMSTYAHVASLTKCDVANSITGFLLLLWPSTNTRVWSLRWWDGPSPSHVSKAIKVVPLIARLYPTPGCPCIHQQLPAYHFILVFHLTLWSELLCFMSVALWLPVTDPGRTEFPRTERQHLNLGNLEH